MLSLFFNDCLAVILFCVFQKFNLFVLTLSFSLAKKQSSLFFRVPKSIFRWISYSSSYETICIFLSSSFLSRFLIVSSTFACASSYTFSKYCVLFCSLVFFVWFNLFYSRTNFTFSFSFWDRFYCFYNLSNSITGWSFLIYVFFWTFFHLPFCSSLFHSSPFSQWLRSQKILGSSFSGVFSFS